MRFHTRLIVPSTVLLIGLQLVVPQGQLAARAEESELVLKTSGEEAKPESKDGKPEAAKEPVKSDSGGAKKDEDSAAKSPAKPAEAQPNPDSSGIYHRGDGVSMPKLIYSVEPEFSEKARRKKIGGNCKVFLVVDTDGNPQNVHVLRSVAEDVPEKEKKLRPAAASLDEKALTAVKQYRFEPATFQGKPVPFALTVEVNFQIF